VRWLNTTDRPHPSFEHDFPAYANYLRSVAQHIEDSYGRPDQRLPGVHGCRAQPPGHAPS